MIEFIALFAAVSSLSGVILGVVGIAGTTRAPGPPCAARRFIAGAWRGPARGARARGLRQATAVGAVVAGSAVWLLTGVPAAGLIATIAVAGLPALVLSGSAERRAINRLAAIEQWTRRIADIVANGLGLQAAIVATAATAPAAIEPQARNLAAAMQAGLSPQAALRRFADEMDDYTCDQVVAPLLLHASDRSEGLSGVLTDISRSFAAEIEMRSTINAKRAGPRFAVRFLTGMTIAVVAFGLLHPDHLAPYATPGGQTVLLALAGLYVVLMAWARRLSLPEPRPRLLAPATAAEAGQQESP